jgi:NAD(P)H-dependent FMN reductase
MSLDISTLIGALPIFNPDDEGDRTPAIVEAFGQSIRAADGLVIACPEYAHGIPGGLKNALDWMVSRDEIPGKPVLLVRASLRSDHAFEALREVLRTMSLKLAPETGYSVHLVGKAGTQAEELLSDPQARDTMRRALETFRDFILSARH